MIKIKNYSVAIMFFLILLCSNAISESIESKTQSISEEIMSPYCPGRTLSSCPSEDARKLRTQISNWLIQGYSVDSVKRQLIGIYGSEVIGQPEFDGFGKVAWLSPFIILFICLTALLVYLKNHKKKNESKVINNTSVEDKLRELENL